MVIQSVDASVEFSATLEPFSRLCNSSLRHHIQFTETDFLHYSDTSDTSTQNYFKSKTKKPDNVYDDYSCQKLDTPRDAQHKSSISLSTSMNHQDIRNSNDKDSHIATIYRPQLTKTDSIDLDCKFGWRNLKADNSFLQLSRQKTGTRYLEGKRWKCEHSDKGKERIRYGFPLQASATVALHWHPRLYIHITRLVDTYRRKLSVSLVCDCVVETFHFLNLKFIFCSKFLEKDLIECSTLNSLENSQRLNWWVDLGICRKVWPLSTSGDGNCLLHAASLAMWGFHDRRLTLRKALHNILSEEGLREVLWRRWRFQQTRINREAGLVFSETEWAREWEEIVALASAEPRNNKNSARRRSMVEKQSSFSCADSIDGNATYDSLEEIHVLALAYVLRRPIIVISDIVLRDINGEALAPITFGGVYLPLDIPQADCHKVPLLLSYDTAHFSALVTMEASKDFPPALIPLIDYENILLPIQFCIDPGASFSWRDYDGREGNWALTEVEHIALLKEYLEICYASPDQSPEEEFYEDYPSDEDYDKKMLDIAINYNNEENSTAGGSSSSPENENCAKNPGQSKSKSAKLQSVAKQFGSIGKSMSKKIKKNIGSITKFGKQSGTCIKFPNSPSTSTPTLGGGYVNGKYRLLCAQLRSKRHDYQEEMIRNYLDCAHERFTQENKNSRDVADSRGIVQCINSDCQNYGTEDTSWMCVSCYEKQKQRESSSSHASDYSYRSPPRYGTGNSKFYTQSDVKSHNVVKRLPSVKKLNELDQTLYLSKSTFFNDTKLSPHNIIGIPLMSPSTPPAASKTTIIPIRVEGQDRYPSDDLINFESINSHTSSSSSSANVAAAAAYDHQQSNLTRNNVQDFTTSYPPSNLSDDFPTIASLSKPKLDDSPTKCRSLGCSFFGSPTTGYCSKCCKDQKVQIQQYRKLQTEI